MNEIVSSFIGLFFAVGSLIALSYILPQIDLRLRIKNYNKRYKNQLCRMHGYLDENTKFSVYNNRFNDWLLEMFCDEKKGDNENEK